MKKKHLVTLVRAIKDALYAHRKADWDDKVVVETVAELITKKFANYMKEQEGLERMGKTEEDFMIPPGGLNR
jgi:type I site-specific restriction endonuclease